MKRREFLQIAATATVCSGIGFYAGRVSRFSLAKYVQLGTSLTAGSGTKYNGRIPELVAHQLGMNSIGINGGLAGSCAGDHKFPSLNSVSLVAICNAIVSGDWSAQSGRRDPAIS